MRSLSIVATLALLAPISLWACSRGAVAEPPSAPAVTAPTVATPPPVAVEQQQQQPTSSRVRVAVRATGYEPASINAPANRPITLVFNRADDGGCGGEVVFPEHNIRRTLAVGQDVEVTLTPRESEQIHFACGMGMLHGTLIASR